MVPSPKSQIQEVGDPVLLSVNVTANGAFPDMGDAENAATGGVRSFYNNIIGFCYRTTCGIIAYC